MNFEINLRLKFNFNKELIKKLFLLNYNWLTINYIEWNLCHIFAWLYIILNNKLLHYVLNY